MKFIKQNWRDILTLIGAILVLILIVALIAGWGYCAINFGSTPITDVPFICYMLKK